ncbi:glycosyltransferase family 2 protein [Candidatus Peregrinibacteria bacterium]|nr:glycosyltransferase family 2 protein [Candidatus Peregrinibacteria bacterium]
MNHEQTSRVTIGILVYNGQKYFDFLFPSLFDQDYSDVEILVLDNNSPEKDAEILEKKWKNKLKIFRKEENLGFAGGHNFLINKMNGEYYLCLNQDILLEKNYVSELVKIMESDEKIASATGKILKWDFSRGFEGKTKFIDTTGISASKAQHFFDRGQGEVDHGQFETIEEIFACSGAAPMYRKAAIEDVSCIGRRDGDVALTFDETFFMYKEDIDLGYRLRFAGWKNVYAPNAIAYHDRTVSSSQKKSPKVREWSYQNHLLLLEKNFSSNFSWKTRICTYLRNSLLSLHFFFSFPRKYFSIRRKLRDNIAGMRGKNEIVKHRVSPGEIEKFFL